MRKLGKKIWKIFKKVIAYYIFLSLISILFFRFVPVPVTYLMLLRCVQQLSAGENVKLKKDWEPLNKITPNLVLAVVASEDQRFTEHWGFDLDAIKKAVRNNEKKRRKTVKGASTISQQTAKNVFLWPGRSWIRKGFEAYFTLLIELFWSKERIMEVYLNVIEMGDGIYGAEAASQTYFHKSADKLTRSEAALIAAILPNPRKWNPQKPSAYIFRRQQWILRNMNNLGTVEW